MIESETVAPPPPIWVVMPAKDCVEMTTQAVLDALAQSISTRVLLVDQGSSRASNDAFRQLAEHHHPRLLLWSHNPPLPCLSACWNRALDFVWSVGGTEALVTNNDVRLQHHMVEDLATIRHETEAWFVSGVGVREHEFDPAVRVPVELTRPDRGGLARIASPGGPDFSCYLISKVGHTQYRFDERFIPAFCEDLDAHRRYLLGGDGWRIFGANLPYLHYASGTVKSFSPEERQTFSRAYDACVATYARKWGGGPSKEGWIRPSDPTSATEIDVRTPTIHDVDRTYGAEGLRKYLMGLSPEAEVHYVNQSGADDAEA